MYPVDEENNNTNSVSDVDENYSSGYIKLFRSINRHWIWQDAEKLKWWLDILLEVNHSDKKVLLGGLLIECKRGQSLNSLETWAKRWRIDKSRVRRFLKLLESDRMIELKNVQKSTQLTVCKYASYNDKRNEDETQMKRKRNASETRATPNNNDKNVNNDKNSISTPEKNKFIKPTIEEITNLFSEKLDDFTAQGEAGKFFNYYESNGWKVGKVPMKKWEAAAYNWIANSNKYNGNSIKKPTGRGSAGLAATKDDLEEYISSRRT